MSTEKVVEEVVDKTSDLAERAATLVESQSMRTADGLYISKGALLANLTVIGFVAGAVGGVITYHITKNRLQTKYEEIAAREIEEAKKFYEIVNKKGEFSTPESAARVLIPEGDYNSLEEAAKAIQKYQGEVEENEEEEVEEKMINVFTEHVVDDDFDFEEEMKNRSPEHPYVIHREEFMEGYSEFDQTTITYYAGDATLADEEDSEIPFSDPIVGEGNLEKFGHGSGDERIVYIRNEKLSTDFEVIKHDGKFSHEVLGFEHSDMGPRERQRRNRLPKFRDDDAR